jgi:hypothetical protein
MEAEIDKLSLDELKKIALKTKLNAMKSKPAIQKWHENHPDKKAEYNKKYYEKQKLKKLAEKNIENPEIK